MPRYESLQAKTMRKMSPRILNQIPSPLLMQGKNELAKHIQRTFRTRNKHAIYRKGSKMTKNAMRRQLYNAYANPGNIINDTFNTINRILVDDYNLEANDDNQIERRNSAIRYIIDNLERPLLEKLYNYTWVLQDDEEDVNHLQNPMYFQQNNAGKKYKNKSKKMKKSKMKKSKMKKSKMKKSKIKK